jgi:arsenate reductase
MKLLFICVKNSSRSQMAEALVKLSRANGFEAYSAGIDPGECVHPHAVKVMQEIGYDLSGNECKHVSAFKKITFDFVAKMDVADLGDAVKAKWIETWNVPDPAQGDVEHFRAVRDLLADRVETLLEKHHDGRQAA